MFLVQLNNVNEDTLNMFIGDFDDGETTKLTSDIFWADCCVTVWTSQAHRGAGTKNV